MQIVSRDVREVATLTRQPRRVRRWIALLVGGMLLFPLCASSRDKAEGTSSGKSPSLKKTTDRPKAQRPTSKASRRRRQRRSTFKHRMARLRLQPQRVEEIQRALAQAGYLDRDPNGKWDDATRNAMLRYQTDHGFPATGLPEAKTLMKLGLGPHALPEALDPTVAARASVDAPQKPAPQGSASPDGPGADAPRH